VTSDGQSYSIVPSLSLSDWAKTKLDASLEELRSEKAVIADLLK
jgi:hypothetical protein